MPLYDTIIIGAGMSGLAAGIRLAHFDQRVCILERHSAIGGLNSFYRQRGRTFDVGLHAVTNYAPKGTHRGPLARLLRQLRLAWEEWALSPQLGSAIVFPGVTLRFSNDFELFESEVRRFFPEQIDNFRRLVDELVDYDQLGEAGTRNSARRGRRPTDRRPAAGRDDLLPGPVLRRRPRARHGFRPVQHHVPLDLPGGLCPAAGRHAADPEDAGPPSSRASAASCGCARAWTGSP